MCTRSMSSSQPTSDDQLCASAHFCGTVCEIVLLAVQAPGLRACTGRTPRARAASPPPLPLVRPLSALLLSAQDQLSVLSMLCAAASGFSIRSTQVAASASQGVHGLTACSETGRSQLGNAHAHLQQSVAVLCSFKLILATLHADACPMDCNGRGTCEQSSVEGNQTRVCHCDQAS